jgi:hypothetical protein
MDCQLSGSLAADGTGLSVVPKTILSREGTVKGETLMMARFCRYIDKVFDFGEQLHGLRDKREKPRIPTAAIWGSAFFLFVLRCRSLNAMEQQVRQPRRIEKLIGKVKPSPDRMGDVMGLVESDQLREMLSRADHQLGRNKALRNDWPFRVSAMDGHEFFFQPTSILSTMF